MSLFLFFAFYNYFSSSGEGQVLSPKMVYNGQNEIRLVKTNIIPRTSNIIASVPEIIPVK